MENTVGSRGCGKQSCAAAVSQPLYLFKRMKCNLAVGLNCRLSDLVLGEWFDFDNFLKLLIKLLY